jgi:hypothetical protein
VVTKLQAGLSGVRIPASQRNCSFTQKVYICFIADKVFSSMGAFRGVKRSECEADYSPPYSAEVVNKWPYTSTPRV